MIGINVTCKVILLALVIQLTVALGMVQQNFMSLYYYYGVMNGGNCKIINRTFYHFLSNKQEIEKVTPKSLNTKFA